MTTKRMTLTLLAAVVVAGCGTTASHARTTRPGSGFTATSAHVNNPWFPLRPGTTFVYKGEKDGKPGRDLLTVTRGTRVIAGVRCAVIRDRLYLRGRLEERTTDWYAQDRAGNVWYYGEQTAELDARGRVKSTEGTWLTGRDGAKPGIYMPAHPRVGLTGRQEYYKGQAEDHYAVLSLGARVATPGASSTHALLTKEWTPLEPGVIDHKLYVRGVGTVREETIKGGKELQVLQSVRHG